MRPRRALPLLTSGLVALGVLACAPAHAGQPTYTAVVVDAGASGAAWVIDGTVVTTPAADSLTWTDGDARVVLTLPSGATFAAFATGPVPLGTTQDATTATLSLTRTTGSTCDVVGTLTVGEATTDGDLPSTFASDFTGTCDAQGHATSGQLRMDSPTAYGGLDVTERLAFSDAYLGEVSATKDVTVTAHGPDPVQIRAVRILADPDQDFVIPYATDHCSGATLSATESCSIPVGASPATADPTGTVTNQLVIDRVDPTAPSSTTLSLTGSLSSITGQYVAKPKRLMDTRNGTGVRTGMVGAGKTVTLRVGGASGYPSGMSAVVLNLTVTGGTRGSYVTAYPAGGSRPGVSSINFPAGWTGANLVTVPVGAGGGVTFYNYAGSVHLIADVVGFYAADHTGSYTATYPGADYYPGDPLRYCDSRTDPDAPGPFRSGDSLALAPDYRQRDADPINERITAIAVNVTVTRATSGGYVSITATEPTGTPTTSALNFTKGRTVSNMAVAEVSHQDWGSGIVPVFFVAPRTSGSVQIIVDIIGMYAQSDGVDNGTRFHPLTPRRIIDTRRDLGLRSVGNRRTDTVLVHAPTAGWDTMALVGNLTGVRPSAGTYLTAWGAGGRPGVSNVSVPKNRVTAGSTWAPLAPGNYFRLYNYQGSPEVLYDVSGSFELFPGTIAQLSGEPVPPPGQPKATGATTPRVPRLAPHGARAVHGH